MTITANDWATYAAASVVLIFIGRIVKAAVHSIYSLANSWRSLTPLVSEVKAIKELLQKGELWMERSDERMESVVRRVDKLEEAAL